MSPVALARIGTPPNVRWEAKLPGGILVYVYQRQEDGTWWVQELHTAPTAYPRGARYFGPFATDVEACEAAPECLEAGAAERALAR